MGSPSSFTIKQLTGDQHSLELKGRALPYQPLTLEGAMRAEFTWYPGNGVASVQMLGGEEKGTTISGTWKDRFIKSVTDEGRAVVPSGVALWDGSQVGDVYDLALLVDSLRKAGQLVEVKWDRFVRRGILLRFKQTWLRIEDLEWEMEFQWVSQGDEQTPPTIPDTPDANDFSKKLTAKLDQLRTALTLPPEFQVVDDFMSQVNSLADIIDDAAVEAENAVRNGIAKVSSPIEVAERVLTSAESVKTAASGIVTAVEQFPPKDLINTSAPDDLNVGDALLATTWSRNIKTQARDIALFASLEGDSLRAIVRRDQLLAVFTARENMDLRDVSRTYYGTTFQWRTLLSFNKFSTSKLSAGQVVLVPKLDFEDANV